MSFLSPQAKRRIAGILAAKGRTKMSGMPVQPSLPKNLASPTMTSMPSPFKAPESPFSGLKSKLGMFK